MKIHPYWKEKIKEKLGKLGYHSSPSRIFKSFGVECDEIEKVLTKDEISATITNDRWTRVFHFHSFQRY